MSLWYQQCKDLTLDQCCQLLVWQHWPRQERNVTDQVLNLIATPGYCLSLNQLRQLFFLSGTPLNQVVKRADVWAQWLGVPLGSCEVFGSPGYSAGASFNLNIMYGLKLLGLISRTDPMGDALNFLDDVVIIPPGQYSV